MQYGTERNDGGEVTYRTPGWYCLMRPAAQVWHVEYLPKGITNDNAHEFIGIYGPYQRQEAAEQARDQRNEGLRALDEALGDIQQEAYSGMAWRRARQYLVYALILLSIVMIGWAAWAYITAPPAL